MSATRERAGSSDAGTDNVLSPGNLRPITPLSAEKMRESVRQTLLWLGAYLVLCLLPLVLLSLRPAASRGFWVELGVGLGIVGFAMLALQSASIARFRRVAPFFGSDAVLLFHRQLGLISLVFVLSHPILLLASEPRFVEYLDPRVNALRAIFLAAACVGVLLLGLLSLARERIGLKYEWWHLSHAGIAAGVLVVGLAHGLQVGRYVSGAWKQALWVLVALGGIFPIVYVRLVRPWQSRRKPYRVAAVHDERGETWTLVLKPEGHAGFRFAGGQFAWLTLGRSPFSLEQHPFSLAGSAIAQRDYRITVKSLGDFTSTIRNVTPGTSAYLDGPYGAFSLGAQRLEGAVMVMGGIGITPALGMLRTCRDRGDRRRLLLIYSNTTWEQVAFREELGALEAELDLKVVHVLEDPPEGWQGEVGLITGDVLDRHLPRDGRDYHYFVCGPPALMEVVERHLAARGIPIWNRSIERFDFV